jgi:microcystin-dependent protein
MNRVDFTQPNGFPLKAETLGFMQDTYRPALNAIAKIVGNANIIISGCIDNGTTVSDGWVYFGGELFFFEGGVKAQSFIVFENIESDTNQNGINVNRYFTRTLRFGSGAVSYNFDDLIRVESIISLTEKNAMFLIESNVIIKGCDVAITGADINITSGVAIIAGQFCNVPAFSGVYPCYFQDDKRWVNQLTAADYLKFDPYTNQRLASVYKRATTIQGEISMQSIDTGKFDSSGLGLWEYHGFALCNGANGTIDLRGRMPIGYDERLSDPNNGIWDSTYNTIGNASGEKEIKLTIAQMPRHNHQVDGDPNGAKYQNVGAGDFGLIQKTVSGQNRTAGSLSTTGSGTRPDLITSPAYVPFQGNNESHENRPPFLVLAFIQRI